MATCIPIKTMMVNNSNYSQMKMSEIMFCLVTFLNDIMQNKCWKFGKLSAPGRLLVVPL